MALTYPGSPDRITAAADLPIARSARPTARGTRQSAQVSVTIGNLAVQAERWPLFVAMAMRAGFTAVTMIPVGPQDGRVGALALLGRTEPDAHGVLLALSLADAAAAGLDLCAELRRQETAIAQLQSALASRIVIEQAKGILAERCKVTPDEAFGVLRRQARTNQQALADLARAVISGTADLARPDPAKRI